MLTAAVLVATVKVEGTVRVSGRFRVFENPVAVAVTTKVELPATALGVDITIKVVDPVPGAMLAFEKLAVTPAGCPLTESAIAGGKFPCWFGQLRVTFVAAPIPMDKLAGFAVSAQFRGIAVMVREMVAV